MALRVISDARAAEDVAQDGLPYPRESILVSRSLETWTHADDIRRALNQALSPPSPDVLHRMAHLSVTTMPASLEMVELVGCASTEVSMSRPATSQ